MCNGLLRYLSWLDGYLVWPVGRLRWQHLRPVGRLRWQHIRPVSRLGQHVRPVRWLRWQHVRPELICVALTFISTVVRVLPRVGGCRSIADAVVRVLNTLIGVCVLVLVTLSLRRQVRRIGRRIFDNTKRLQHIAGGLEAPGSRGAERTPAEHEEEHARDSNAGQRRLHPAACGEAAESPAQGPKDMSE